MNVCVCAELYIVYIYIYTYVYIHLFACVQLYKYVCACIFVCERVCSNIQRANGINYIESSSAITYQSDRSTISSHVNKHGSLTV